MSGITPELVLKLVAQAGKLGIPARIDDLKEQLLDHAFDDLNFDGDEEALWQQLRTQLGAAPVQLTPDRRRQQHGRPPRNPDAPPPWSAADAQNCTAPYRFTALNGKVSRLPEGQQHALNDFDTDRTDAVIKLDWRVETPILIGEKTDDVTAPFRLGNDWALPGATLRGLLRSTVESIAFGRLFQLNRHKRFALRDFDHEAYGEFTRLALGMPGLQAGWLRITDDGPQITACDWGYIRIETLTDQAGWKAKDRAWKYNEAGIDWRGKNAFSVPQEFANIGAHPNHNGRNIFEKASGGLKGHCVFSGMSPGKKFFEYVLFDQPNTAPKPLSDRAWADFLDLNCKPSQNGNTPMGAWAEFHQHGVVAGRVPIFYMGDLDNNGTDAGFYFGLTRLFRIPHKFRLGEVLLRAGNAHRPAEIEEDRLVLKPDFVENLFGYVYEPADLEFGHKNPGAGQTYTPLSEIARKGRIAFGFARPSDDSDFQLWPQNPINSILAAPKPSFAPFYLAGKEKDFSAPSAKLAGRKRYIVRKMQGDAAPETGLQKLLEGQNANVPGDVHSHLQFLKPGKNAVFKSEIRLSNVSKAELGCILWALTFGGDGDCRHLVGHAKAFGAGQVRVSRLTVYQKPHRGDPTAEINWASEDGRNGIETLLGAFETQIASLLGFEKVADWRNSPEITQLLEIARPRGFDAPNTTYLPFDRDAKHFSALRKKTGLGARQVPNRLLEP